LEKAIRVSKHLKGANYRFNVRQAHSRYHTQPWLQNFYSDIYSNAQSFPTFGQVDFSAGERGRGCLVTSALMQAGPAIREQI